MKTVLAAALCALVLPLCAQAQSGAPAVDGPTRFDAVPADAASPFGGLSLSPTRLVLEPGKPLGQIALYNSGGEPVTYRIESVELEALSEGGFAPLPDGAATPDWAASPYLRHAPRQVTLQPGERQVVKVMARAPRDMEAGELRSHLRFSSIPTVAAVDEAETMPPERGGDTVEVKVGLEYRITIPVILRTGRAEAGVAIQSARLEADPDTGGIAVKVELARSHAWSALGVVRVLDASGAELGRVRGVSVLAPLTRRTIAVPIGASGARPARPARVVFEPHDAASEPIAQLDLG